MASHFAFAPSGPAVFVGATATFVTPTQPTSNSFYIVNLSGTIQYLTHGLSSSVTSAGAPVAGTPSVNTVAIPANAGKAFTGLFPWMIASSATGFVVTPGDGV